MANVKFQAPNPYSQQAADLNRRQKMAEMLQQQSMEPLQQQSAGGMVIPLNPLAGLAKVLQSYTSSRQLSDLDKKRAALEAQDIQNAQEMAAQFRTRSVDQPIAEGDNTLRELAVRPIAQSSGVKPVVKSQLMKAGLAPGSEDYEAASAPARLNELVEPAIPLAERQQNLLPAALGAGVGPYQQKLAQMLYEKQPEVQQSAFNKPDIEKYTPASRILYQNSVNAGKPNPSVLELLPVKGTEPTVSTLSKLISERSKLVAIDPTDPNIKIYDAAISRESKGPPGTSVSVNTGNRFSSKIAEGLAETDIATINSARNSPAKIQSAQRIKSLLDLDPILGTGANPRLSIEKALSTAGLIDPARARATENLVSALASSTLDSVKTSGLGTGQGFTDKDLEFLEKAKSGNITINRQTLRDLADLQEKASRLEITKGNRILKRLRDSKEFGSEFDLSDIEIPPLNNDEQPPPGAVRRKGP